MKFVIRMYQKEKIKAIYYIKELKKFITFDFYIIYLKYINLLPF